MRFLHKHEDYRVVANLAFIEAPRNHVDITPIDSSGFLRQHTETELQLLYRNTAGVDHSPHYGDALRGVLAALAERLPHTDAVVVETDKQAAALGDDGSHDPHKYVKGSTKPARPADLYTPAPLRATLSDDEAATAARRRAAQPAPQATAPGPVAGSEPAAPRVRAVMPARQQGKTREAIWQMADKMWQEDGQPRDKAAVLHLRKKVMDVLERAGIKRTSCSSELGNWQKARI
jgi:hypothetical protein